MYHESAYNPAQVGSASFGDVNMVIREQYMKFVDDAGPSTMWFNASLPIKKFNSGVGISLSRNKQGFEERIDFKLNYAYHINLGSGKFGFGVSVGGNTIGWSVEDPIYPDGSSDGFVDSEILSKDNFTNLLLGVGVYYKVKGLYSGFAVTEINEPNLKFESDKREYFKRHYWLSAGYDFKTSNPMWTIKPSILVKTSFADAQVNVDLLACYNNLIVAGGAYTSGNDFSLIAGVKFSNGGKLDGARAIISYDIIGSKLRTQSAGNLEIMLGYSFNLSVEKVNKTYKSVRFL